MAEDVKKVGSSKKSKLENNDKLLTTLKGLLRDNRFSDFAEDINRDIRFTEGLRKVFAEELIRAKEEREQAAKESKTEEMEKEQSENKTEGQEDFETEDEEGNKVKYSIKESTSSQIRKAMEDSAEFTQSHVYLGETPQNLVEILGLRKLPMLMSKKKVYLVTRAEGKYTGKKANYHNLGAEGLEQAIEAIKNPAIIMESMSVEGSIVIITEVKDKEGAPVIVAIHPNSKGTYQDIRIDTNTVTSAYGKNIDFTEWLTDFVNQDKLLWIDNKKSRQFLMNSSPRVQFPSSGVPVSFDSNIARFQETVKKLDEKKKALEEEAQRKREEKQRKQEEKEEARTAWLEKMRKEKAERDKAKEAGEETEKAKLSIRASELAVLQKENEKLSAINENLRKQFTITKGIVFDEVTAEKAVRKWLKEYKSKADAKEVTEKVLRIAKEMREGKIPQGEQIVEESEDFVISENAFITGQSALYILAEEVLEKSEDLDRSAAEEHRDLLDKLKKTKIKVGESLKEELDYYGGYNNIRKANFGKVNLSQKEGIPIDSLYPELAEMYPEFFNEEKQRTEGDMMIHNVTIMQLSM